MRRLIPSILFCLMACNSFAQSDTWAVKFADAIIKRHQPNINNMTGKGWEYSNSIILHGIEKLYNYLPDSAVYLNYIKAYVDAYVNSSGTVSGLGQSLDKIHPGLLCLFLYEKTGQSKYQIAATNIRNYLLGTPPTPSTYPKTPNGGYWHKNTSQYSNVMMLDGMYMAHPFLVKYGTMFNDQVAIDSAVNQVLFLHNIAYDPTTHLVRHAWNYDKSKSWADPVTGLSHDIWSRGTGWYMMALVDILRYLPTSHPKYNDIKTALSNLSIGIANTQDPTSGLWYQVVDKAGSAGNWIETSGSGMYIYAIKTAATNGWIDSSYLNVARKGWAGYKQYITIDADGGPKINQFAPAMSVLDNYSAYVNTTPVSCPPSSGTKHPHGYCATLMAATAMEFPFYSITTNAVNGQIVRSPSGNSFSNETVITLTAQPNNGYEFTGWSGDITGTTTTITVVLNSNKNITANFAASPAVCPYIFTGNGNWTTAANWSCGLVPSTGKENITVANGANIILNTDYTVAALGTITFNPTSSLTINPNTTLAISGLVDFNDQHVIIKSDATGSGAIGKVLGSVQGVTNITVERYIPASRSWRLITAPLANNTSSIYSSWQNNGIYEAGKGTWITGPGADPLINGLDDSNANHSAMYLFDIATQTFAPVTNTYTSHLSKNSQSSADNIGYLLFIRGDRNPDNINNVTTANATTLSGTGALQTGDQTFVAKENAGYTLIGNPYPANIDFHSISRTNVSDKFWSYATDTYLGRYIVASWDIAENQYNFINSVTGVDSIIQSGQAVFVQSISGSSTASVTIKENDKVANTNKLWMFRPQNILSLGSPSLKLQLYSSTEDGSAVYLDEAITKYHQLYSTEVGDDDAAKFDNQNETISLERNGQKLALERRTALAEADTIFINLNKATTKNYVLKLQTNGLDYPRMVAHLEDTKLNTKTAINLNGETVINTGIIDPTTDQNRFRVVFKQIPNVVLGLFTSVKAWNSTSANIITVEWAMSSENEIRYYEIERSIDGYTFIGINKTIAANNKTYRYNDINSNTGNNYYRIKTVSNSGEIKYSEIVKVVTGNTTQDIVLFPNPVINNQFSIQLKNQPKGNYTLRLFNSTGQLLMNNTIVHYGGNRTELITVPQTIVNGTYRLEIQSPGKKATIRSIVLNK